MTPGFKSSAFHAEIRAVIRALNANDASAPMAATYIDQLAESDKRTLRREAPGLLDELDRIRVAAACEPSTTDAMHRWVDEVLSLDETLP